MKNISRGMVRLDLFLARLSLCRLIAEPLAITPVEALFRDRLRTDFDATKNEVSCCNWCCRCLALILACYG